MPFLHSFVPLLPTVIVVVVLFLLLLLLLLYMKFNGALKGKYFKCCDKNSGWKHVEMSIDLRVIQAETKQTQGKNSTGYV